MQAAKLQTLTFSVESGVAWEGFLVEWTLWLVLLEAFVVPCVRSFSVSPLLIVLVVGVEQFSRSCAPVHFEQRCGRSLVYM